MKLSLLAFSVMFSLSSFAGSVSCSGSMYELGNFKTPSNFLVTVPTSQGSKSVLVDTANYTATLVQEMGPKFVVISSKKTNFFSGSVNINTLGVTNIPSMRAAEAPGLVSPFLSLNCLVTEFSTNKQLFNGFNR